MSNPQLVFHKPRRSQGSGNCVEVAGDSADSAGVFVRDSKDQQGPMLSFDPQAWTAFTHGLKNKGR